MHTLFIMCIHRVGVAELGIGKFQAKIGTDNHASLKLFQDKLAFIKVCANSELHPMSP